MFVLPRPRSSQLATRAPPLSTAEVAEWNFGASAEAAAANASVATSAAVASTIHRRDLLMVLLPLRGIATQSETPLDTDHQSGRAGVSDFQPGSVSSGAAEPQNSPLSAKHQIIDPGGSQGTRGSILSMACEGLASY